MNFGRFLFLDSCVVIVDVFRGGPDLESVDKMKEQAKKEGIPLLITSTAQLESMKNVRGLITLVGNELRELRSALLERKETSDINGTLGGVSNEDMEFVSRYFRSLRRRHKAKRDMRAKLQSVETLVTDYIEGNAESNEISVSELLTFLTAEIFDLEDKIRTALLEYTSNSMKYEVTDLEVRSLRKAIPKIKKNNDARIILEANEHRKENPRTVLVSLDYRDILDQAEAINVEVGILCSNPAHAVRRVRYLDMK